MNRLKFHKKDFIIAGTVIIVCAVIAFCMRINNINHEITLYAVISQNSDDIKTICLSDSENMIFSIGNVEFEVKDKGIAIIHSDCKDKICMSMGFIYKKGQQIICMPNKIIVTVTDSP